MGKKKDNELHSLMCAGISAHSTVIFSKYARWPLLFSQFCAHSLIHAYSLIVNEVHCLG